MGGYLVLLILSVLLLVGLISVAAKDDRAKQYRSFDQETGTLTLFTRHKDAIAGLFVFEVKTYAEKYHPSKLIYTSATVGGITTGGFHTTEAYQSSHLLSGSGRYGIYSMIGKTTPVKKIILDSSEMVKQAQRDPRVSNFLHGNTLNIWHEATADDLSESEKWLSKSCLQSGDLTGATNATSYYLAKHEGLSSKPECEAVLAWIKGE